jgi:hypothetical protein
MISILVGPRSPLGRKLADVGLALVGHLHQNRDGSRFRDLVGEAAALRNACSHTLNWVARSGQEKSR